MKDYRELQKISGSQAREICQDFSDSLDLFIAQCEGKLPQGTNFILMKERVAYGWNGVEGKNMRVGLAIDKDIIEYEA